MLRRVQMAIVVLIAILVALIFLRSPGTEDMDAWIQWANNADIYGAVAGYEANKDFYPPFASVILLSVLRVSHFAGLELFDAIKISIFLFLCLTSFLFWLWTRDFAIAALLHFSLLLNSVALGCIDIYFAPSLTLSLWALKEGRLTLFSVFFAIAVLIKWQPIIILPFIAIYILNIAQVTHWKRINAKKLAIDVLSPTIAIAILAVSIFGVTATGKAFLRAIRGDNLLSGNALNFNWLITHFLHVLYPERFGSLIDGLATYIDVTGTESLKITFIPRLLFVLFYITTVALFFKRNKSFENLILFSLIGYLAYFTFNIGVHENHLFITSILSIVLFWVNRKHSLSMIIILLMSNLNLFLFYGIDGMGLPFNRAIGDIIDTALLLSLFNVSFFLYFWVVNILLAENSAAAQHL